MEGAPLTQREKLTVSNHQLLLGGALARPYRFLRNGVRAAGALRTFILTKAFSEDIFKAIRNGFFSMDQIQQAAKAESATLMSNVALEKLRRQLCPCTQAAVRSGEAMESMFSLIVSPNKTLDAVHFEAQAGHAARALMAAGGFTRVKTLELIGHHLD